MNRTARTLSDEDVEAIADAVARKEIDALADAIVQRLQGNRIPREVPERPVVTERHQRLAADLLMRKKTTRRIR